MLDNSSSSSNDSLLHHHRSHGNNYRVFSTCFISAPTSDSFTAFFMAQFFIVFPLCVLVLHLGLKQWRRMRSTSTSAMSHSDSFTYHVVILELIGVFGYSLCLSGKFGGHVNVVWAGFFLWSLPWYGQMLFQTLTCLEHYLAVVHPVTYRNLKSTKGTRIRNFNIGCSWLLCAVGTGLMEVKDASFVVDVCILSSSLLIICFCSCSVLFVLIRPRPGEKTGDKKRDDQSKRRAFYIVVAMLVLMLLRIILNLLSMADIDGCLIMSCSIWINMPSTLALPLLFLHRAGILASCTTTMKQSMCFNLT